MFHLVRFPRKFWILATGSILCLMGAAVFSAHAQPMLLPDDMQPMARSGTDFEERFSPDQRAEPVFTRPQIQSLLPPLPLWAAADEDTALAEAVTEPGLPVPLPFAEREGPARDLQGLAPPSKDVDVQQAEAGTPLPSEAPPAPDIATEAQSEPPPPQDTASISTRELDPPSPPRPDEVAGMRPEQDESTLQEPASPPREEAGRLQDMAAAPAPPVEPAPQAAAPAVDQAQRAIQQPEAEGTREALQPRQGTSSPEGTEAPKAEERRYTATGRATWYQHPGRTANGERFNPDQLTAAHHTLPFGTWLRVINEQTGRSINVRINDRIPRSTRLIVIDLSRGSARALGISGIAQVSLREDIEPYAQTVPEDQPAARSFIAALGTALARSVEHSQFESSLRDSLRQRATGEINIARTAERARFVESALRALLWQRAAQL